MVYDEGQLNIAGGVEAVNSAKKYIIGEMWCVYQKLETILFGAPQKYWLLNFWSQFWIERQFDWIDLEKMKKIYNKNIFNK